MKISAAFKRLKTIRSTDPTLTPETWCDVQPCVNIKLGSKQFLLTQPSSTFFVYLLGMLTIGVGLNFLRLRSVDGSHLWWGISMLLWGIGALLAGTSYQAFGYQIKCRGQETVAWTSWWEVIYLIFQQLSMDALLVAVALSCSDGTLQTLLLAGALICGLVYSVVTFIGGMLAIKSLITFERMVWVSTPIFLILCILNGWRYYQSNSPLDLSLIGAWILLLLTMAAYGIYDKLGITPKLWTKGIWFSQNDVLHIGLILWMIYLAAVVTKLVTASTIMI
ncbi:MAG TPA: hypothetical protein DCY42_06670 [Chloroflexi bacterium]|nr:hypothetical protein [Chloroflexota bacterium]